MTSPSRIVLSRLDRIGDLILSTPAIASVRHSWPDAHVTLVCSGHNAGVVQRNVDVDETVVLASGESAWRAGARFRGKVDLAIALAPRAHDFTLIAATRAARRIGYTYVRRYAARLSAWLFLTDVAVSEADPDLCDRDGAYAVRHEVDQILSLVSLAGGKPVCRDLVITISEEDRRAVASVPAGGIAVQLAPRWISDGSTLESTLELLRMLRRFGVPIVAVYGSDATDLAERVRIEGVADAVLGGLPFSRWAAVYEKCAVVVTVDTGATHLASATCRPTVVLFEHRYFNLNSQEWSPYNVPSVLLRKPADERPASLERMRAEIVAAVASLLGAA
ncbi:MAG: glycosyltransferase family 9 protein [Candidatus Eremiobacteraeota bacterium]|nr:glycosyltransferase family 9 protein [Candidatus Eremiobacteraeota bacterium]